MLGTGRSSEMALGGAWECLPDEAPNQLIFQRRDLLKEGLQTQ